MLNRACANCKYFVAEVNKKRGEDHDGECRRYPPVYSGSVREGFRVYNQFWFPIVQKDEWCGEFDIEK